MDALNGQHDPDGQGQHGDNRYGADTDFHALCENGVQPNRLFPIRPKDDPVDTFPEQTGGTAHFRYAGDGAFAEPFCEGNHQMGLTARHRINRRVNSENLVEAGQFQHAHGSSGNRCQ